MAYIHDSFCSNCKTITQHINWKCTVCSEALEKERIRVWEAHDIEWKLTNLRERIEKLERNPIDGLRC
jgi:hypothetical protein